MKRCLPAVALALLAFPAAAPAASVVPIVNPDLRGPQQPAVPTVSPHAPARGTDVAAPDQQAPATVSVPASSASGFDWADAGIGAAGATGLLAISLAGGMSIRRRAHRRTSALA